VSCLGILDAVQSKEKGIGVMGVSEFLMILGTMSPALVLWIAVIVFAAVRLRRGGGRAERFLIAGGIIKLAGTLLSIPSLFIIPWLIGKGYDISVANSVVSGWGMFLKVVGMAGIICLIYAFWVKFKEENIEAAVSVAP